MNFRHRPFDAYRPPLTFTFESGAQVIAHALNPARRILGRPETATRCQLNGRDQWPAGYRVECPPGFFDA